VDANIVGGLVRARGENERTLHLGAIDVEGRIGNYILDAELNLIPEDDDTLWDWLQENAAIPSRDGVLAVDSASVIYTDDAGRRFRLPKNVDFVRPGPLGFGRLCREVATERDLFNCHGTFFELPAENAGGFGRVRPVATHNRHIFDYCSYRGLLVISGINMETAGDNRHVIRSGDGKAALWVGAVDDVWKLGKPVGVGGPWLDTEVDADEVSDPYLMTGYDRKTLTLKSNVATTISAEIDLTGTGLWKVWRTYDLQADVPVTEPFPDAFGAYWIRFRSSNEARVSAQLRYE
jgi:hypothetical protein